MRKPIKCMYPDCDRWATGQERCGMHYQRDMKRGAIKPMTPEQRFWSKVEKTDNCWIWHGVVDHGSGGYARYCGARAHRLAYEYLVGAIPDGLVVDHRCQNRICVNPDHLRVCTLKENSEHLKPRENLVRGVCWHKQHNKWQAYATHNRGRYYGGIYDTIEEAEKAAIELRNRLFTHNDLDRGESVA